MTKSKRHKLLRQYEVIQSAPAKKEPPSQAIRIALRMMIVSMQGLSVLTNEEFETLVYEAFQLTSLEDDEALVICKNAITRFWREIDKGEQI